MIDENTFFCLMKRCDIYFEGSLISKELILQNYVEFISSSFFSKKRLSSVALHTGSICFDIIAILMSALVSISLDNTNPDEIIADLSDGEMVLYDNERYRWYGLETVENKLYMRLEQDGRGQHGPLIRKLSFEAYKGLIKPYKGTSEMTDGRGIRKQKTNRSDFISFITGKKESDIPSVTGVSVVIVSDRAHFDRIQKGLRISYNEKQISLLDIVAASYYTDGDEPYQFGSNPSKAEPVLKVVGKVSVARDLVLDKRGNKAIGFVIIDSEAVSKGSSELEDLLTRKSLKFTLISMGIDSKNAEVYIDDNETSVFACTKEFLLNYSKPTVISNMLTDELDRQVGNIINNEIVMETVEGGCSWEIYKKIKNTLFVIKQSNWEEEQKKNFIVSAYSLLNLFTTAVFSMNVLEQAVGNGELQLGISSPAEKLNKLRMLAKKSDILETKCTFVVDELEDLYKTMTIESQKYQALKQLVQCVNEENIAIIIPKAYYADILKKESLFSQGNVHIATANRYNSKQHYDKVIVVGDFSGKRFDALKCKDAVDIIVLLYECEKHWFEQRKCKAARFEKRLDMISGVSDNLEEVDGIEIIEKNVEQLESETLDLEKYVSTISVHDIRKFATGFHASGGNNQTSEVSAIGRFVGGEQILFSKFYKAVVYNPSNTKEAISETDVGKLVSGDKLVFTKRDSFTRNIVDSIYDALQISGKLNENVLDATKKAVWWKKVLRDYQQKHGLTYKQLAKELKKYGCSLSEMSIRQWLVPESHIVGPREESTLRQIAEMTGDSYLLGNTSGYFDACKIVRRQRKKILELIGKAIEERLSGHNPPYGSELEIVYKNIEALSETLELEAVTFLDEAVLIPINLINKPISDLEVAT